MKNVKHTDSSLSTVTLTYVRAAIGAAIFLTVTRIMETGMASGRVRIMIYETIRYFGTMWARIVFLMQYYDDDIMVLVTRILVYRLVFRLFLCSSVNMIRVEAFRAVVT